VRIKEVKSAIRVMGWSVKGKGRVWNRKWLVSERAERDGVGI